MLLFDTSTTFETYISWGEILSHLGDFTVPLGQNPPVKQQLTNQIFTLSFVSIYLRVQNLCARWGKKICQELLDYLVGPYYAGPKSTPAHFTPALIPPRANFDLPPFLTPR